MKTHYRTIWISDTHLCSPDCRVDDLARFLKYNKSDYLYLVGDIVDVWQLKRRWNWPPQVNSILNKILKRASKGTQVIFVPGNHDELFRSYVGYEFGGVKILYRAEHTKLDGKKLLVMHGDEMDMCVQHTKWLAFLGDAAYDHLIRVNRYLNWVRGLFGLRYWSLAAALKVVVKQAVLFISNFENAMVYEVKKAKVDGVVSGHIHQPACKNLQGIEYYNCGDWIENCTALVETVEGEIKLINWLVDGANIPETEEPEIKE